MMNHLHINNVHPKFICEQAEKKSMLTSSTNKKIKWIQYHQTKVSPILRFAYNFEDPDKITQKKTNQLLLNVV